MAKAVRRPAEPTDTVLPINWFGPLSSRRWCGPASH